MNGLVRWLCLSRRLAAVLVLAMLVGVAASMPSHAQSVASEDPVATATAKLQALKGQLDSLKAQIENGQDNDAALVNTKVKLDEQVQALLQVSVDLRPRFTDVKARLEQLGEPPAQGQPPEPEAVTQERNKLVAERLEINNLTAQAEDLSVTATNLSNTITQIRRDLFTERLFSHTEISVDVMLDAARSFSSEIAAFERITGNWLSFVWKFKRAALISALMLSLAMALVLLFVEYRLFGKLIRADEKEEEPTYVGRLSVAFWSTIIPSLAVAAFLFSTYFFFDIFNVLRTDVAPILSATFGLIGFLWFASMLGRAVLAPRAPKWRLMVVSDRGASTLFMMLIAMVIINGLDYVLGTVSVALSSPVVLTVMKSFLSSVVVGLLFFATSFFKPMLAEDGNPSAPGRPWPRAVAITLRLIGLVLIVLALIGFVGLARFLATQLIVTGAVAATMYIGILSGREISAPNRFKETRVGMWMARRFHLSPVVIDQSGMVAGLLIYLFTLVIGLPLVLISWGFQPRDLQIWTYRIFTEIQIGSIRISLLGILGGLLMFGAGLVVTRWFQKWFDGSVLARSHVDAGVRNSVRTGAGYLGTAIAALIGISAAGIDLSSLALVAGALSLGIGFGLQNIVSNFVSGLILLAERPFKVGDWVATGTTEGFVRRISVRATEIETFQRQSIIVPNSELINASVGNWTHRNSLARVDVPVGVSYNADPKRVLALLSEIGAAQPGVMSTPEPFVIFLGFGASALEFQLCVFVPDILNSLDVKNGLRIEIFERFKAEGIEIPFQKQDVNLFLRETAVTEAMAAARRAGLQADEHAAVARLAAEDGKPDGA